MKDGQLSEEVRLAIEAHREREWDAEVHLAAKRLLTTRRRVAWLRVLLAVAAIVWIGATGWAWPSREWVGPAGILLGLLAVCYGIEFGKHQSADQWLFSLRRLGPLLPVLASDVPLHRWAEAYLDGRLHLPGAVEKALTTLWGDEFDKDAREDARGVLARNGVPDVSSPTYEPDRNAPFPLWQRDGVDIGQALGLLAGRHCVPWLVAVDNGMVIQLCPCGGIKHYGGRWLGRDLARHAQAAGAAGGGAP